MLYPGGSVFLFELICVFSSLVNVHARHILHHKNAYIKLCGPSTISLKDLNMTCPGHQAMDANFRPCLPIEEDIFTIPNEESWLCKTCILAILCSKDKLDDLVRKKHHPMYRWETKISILKRNVRYILLLSSFNDWERIKKWNITDKNWISQLTIVFFYVRQLFWNALGDKR